jgi:hypothetical protein
MKTAHCVGAFLQQLKIVVVVYPCTSSNSKSSSRFGLLGIFFRNSSADATDREQRSFGGKSDRAEKSAINSISGIRRNPSSLNPSIPRITNLSLSQKAIIFSASPTWTKYAVFSSLAFRYIELISNCLFHRSVTFLVPRSNPSRICSVGNRGQGYNAKASAELLNAKPREIKSVLSGQLASGRTQGLQTELLAAGIPQNRTPGSPRRWMLDLPSLLPERYTRVDALLHGSDRSVPKTHRVAVATA